MAQENPSPVDLLRKQVEILEAIFAQQATLLENQKRITDGEVKWFNAILDEQRKHTEKLSNISSVATLIGILTILGIVIGILNSCSAGF